MSKPTAPFDAWHEDTRAVLAGRDPAAFHGFVNTPIYRGSTVLFPDMESLLSRKQRYVYGTRGTPTTDALETAWTGLAGAAGSVIVPSGLAAVALALLASVRSGEHVLVTDSVYEPTRDLCNGLLKGFGVEVSYYDPLIGAGIAALFRPNTRAVFLESPGSQTLEVQDVPAIAAAARERDITVLMDNTWATPLLFDAHAHGVDIAIDASTKYLSGHADLLLGIVSGTARHYPKVRATFGMLGICAGPEDVFLALRGLRTLPLRLREQGERTLEMARWFAARPEVKTVLHPALPSHPQHALFARDFKGSSSLFSVVLHPVPRAAVAAMVNDLSLFGLGFSWGGYESLVVPFDCTAYRTATRFAPGGPCLRFQIGLEHPEDLKRDLDQGFARLRAAAAASA